ncbi:MAG TPA: zinc ribbon domain-containing protein [Actinomycetota bacterium]|nr:zinc ribbon domain-containing protein [Actinomycetota bacterium]
MPIYEYACTSCGERTEAKQSFADPPLEDCPHCGGKLRKLFSPVGIVFKGSGFYSTDAKSGSKSSGSGSGSADKSSDSAKTDTKTESKSDSKPAAKKDGAATEKSA